MKWNPKKLIQIDEWGILILRGTRYQARILINIKRHKQLEAIAQEYPEFCIIKNRLLKAIKFRWFYILYLAKHASKDN